MTTYETSKILKIQEEEQLPIVHRIIMMREIRGRSRSARPVSHSIEFYSSKHSFHCQTLEVIDNRPGRPTVKKHKIPW